MNKLLQAMMRYARSTQGREQVAYLIFGVLTTLCNFIAYYVLTRLISLSLEPATVVAWLISVVFAFITNKLFVFKSKSWAPRIALPELGGFFAARALSLLMDMLVLILLVNTLHMNDLVAKVPSNILVIVFNYVASKWIIFIKNKKGDVPPKS